MGEGVESCLMGVDVQFCKVLKVSGSAMRTQSTLLTVPITVVKLVSFMPYAFYQN